MLIGHAHLIGRPRSLATWNPLDKAAGITLSNNDRTMTVTASGTESLRSIHGKSQGKWYLECTISNGANNPLFGIADSAMPTSNYPGQTAGSYSYSAFDGTKYNNAVATAYGVSYTTGDVIGLAVDFVNLQHYFRKNGTWQNSGDPVAVTGGIAFSGGTYYIAIGDGTSGTATGIAVLNCGHAEFNAAAPAGFIPWSS